MKNTKKKGENRLANNKTLSIVGAIVAVCLIAILTIHFVVPSFSWYWFAFCAILVVVPCGICCIYVFRNQKISFTPKQKTIEIRRSVKMVLLWLLADLLFMAIFNGFTTWIYILGVTFVLATLLNLANALLREGKRNAVANFFSALDLLLCLFATIYLIYIIPLELQRLQTIVTTIIAAVYGGLLTLFGVAWTIRKTNNDRQEDEKKKFKPLLIFFNGSNESDYEIKLEEVDKKTFVVKKTSESRKYPYILESFKLYNINFNDCFIVGLIFNGTEHYWRKSNLYVEKNKIVLFSLQDSVLCLEQPINTIGVLVKDLLGNFYVLDLSFNTENDNKGKSFVYINGSKGMDKFLEE